MVEWIESSTPCRNGHNAPRYVATGRCQTCMRTAISKCMHKKRSDPSFHETELAEAREYQSGLRAEGRDWGSRNKDRHREMKAEWRRNNLARACANVVKRKTAKYKATPVWLTRSHLAQMVALYELAGDMTRATGDPHEVDHIVPLQGRTVCGLHVPWNLRVIPAIVNNSRPRIWDAEKGQYNA